MDNLETKAQEMLDAAKAKTIEQTKELITKSAEEVNQTIEKKNQEWQIKFDAMDKEVQEYKSQAELLKQKNEQKTVHFNDALKEALVDPENIEKMEKFRRKETKEVSFELKAVGDMSLANITDLAAANVQMLPGIIPIPNRKLHIRQLLPTGQMSTSAIHYLQETGSDGSVAAWADNSGAKSQIDFNLKEQIAPSEFIAGYLRITRKALDDISAMRSFLQARLLEKYLNAEDQQLLNGNGTSPQLDGLITNAEAYAGFRTIPVEKIIDACAQIEGNDFMANGILLNPKQYYALLMTRGNTLEYTLPGGSAVNVINGQIYIAGIPVYKSTAMNTVNPAQDAFLVGDWAMGAQLFIRENPVVRFFEEDGTNVRENKITVRVEGRVALPIYHPDAFVTGSLNSNPS
jgi:HK97 family phage major capsid protein